MESIAIIIQTLTGGGAERNAANLSILLSKYYNVHLIVFDGSNISYPHAGVLHDLKMPAVKNKLYKILNIYRRIKVIRKIKKDNNIIASISLMDGANIVNSFSKVNDKIITSVRNNMSYVKANNKLFYYLLNKVILNKSNCCVTVSKDVERDLIVNFNTDPNKLKTIYNSININYFKNLNKNKRCLDKEIIISTMGRLEYQKGQWHLIRILKKVISQYPSVKLNIYGEGTLKEMLIQLTQKAQLTKNITFKGYVKNPHEELIKSDLFVFPSLAEGLGNALLEVMACGVPCIATDCHSGNREILDDDCVVKENLDGVEYAKYGVLVSVDKNYNFEIDTPLTYAENQMLEAVINLIENKALREYYSKKSIERAQDFSFENISRQWCEIIEN